MASCTCTESPSTYYSPVLLKDPERACFLEILLQKRDGIEKVSTVPDIASVVIYFDPKKLPKVKAIHPFGCVTGKSGQKENPPLSVTLRN